MNKITRKVNYVIWHLPMIWKPALFGIVLLGGWIYYLTNGLYN